MRTLLLLALTISTACGPPVPEPGASAMPEVNVFFEPEAVDAGHVASVVHVHVTSAELSSAAVSLFQGSLSSYYLGKVKQGELPETLISRQVPVVSFRVDAELTVAPLQPLSLGPYSLVSADGLIAEFQVTTAWPLLTRVWPPAGAPGSPRFAVYCQDGTSATEAPQSGSVVFKPRPLSVEVSAGVEDSGLFAERCLHFAADGELHADEILVPPPTLGGWALAPALFSESAVQVVEPVLCREGEVPFGPGCATSADDRVLVRTPLGALLWVVHTARGAWVEVTRNGRALTVPGLSPDSLEHLWGDAHDESGGVLAFDLSISTAAARERPILNEALADALGPEPKSEWLEIFNAGTLRVDLAKYTLKDSGGITPLPRAWLAPKEYGLLVREDFAPNGSDEPPRPEARLIRVPALGKSGLSNKGEQLALMDDSGNACSVLPALIGKPGQSLARLNPAAPDDDSKSFSFGTPTPGFANDPPPINSGH